MISRRLLVVGGGSTLLAGWFFRGAVHSGKPPGVDPASPERLAAISALLQERGEAARLASLCSAGNPTGVGLRGEYFSQHGATGTPGTVRIDPTIDFDSPEQFAALPGGARVESVRWTGWIKAHVSGKFKFDGGSPGVVVRVSEQVLSGAAPRAIEFVELKVGRYFPIRIDLDRSQSADAPVRLRWTAPYGAQYLVPRQMLFLPTAT